MSLFKIGAKNVIIINFNHLVTKIESANQQHLRLSGTSQPSRISTPAFISSEVESLIPIIQRVSPAKHSFVGRDKSTSSSFLQNSRLPKLSFADLTMNPNNISTSSL